MTARLNLKTPTFLVLVALLCVLCTLPAAAQEDDVSSDSPSIVVNHYLLTAQRLALLWVATKPWPTRYGEYLSMAKEDFSPLLSEAALMELRAKPETGPKELLKAATDPQADDDEVYEGMIACVAKAHFTVLAESIQGDQATVDIETTVADPFGSGKTESFQDQLVLVRENGRWVLTPEAFKTFVF